MSGLISVWNTTNDFSNAWPVRGSRRGAGSLPGSRICLISEAKRRAIRQTLLDLVNQDEDVALCNQSALEGALMLDRMEDEDAQRKSR